MSTHHSAVSGIQSVESLTDALVALIKLRPRYVAYLAKIAVQKITHDDFSVKDIVMPPGSVRDDATMSYGLLSGSVSEESTMSIEDDSPVCWAILQYLTGASSHQLAVSEMQQGLWRLVLRCKSLSVSSPAQR